MARDGSLEHALSKEHFKAVTDARREIWTGGFTGMVCGTVVGLAVAVIGKKAGFAPKWGANEMLFGALSGTAAGGLVGAQVRGRPAIDNLGRSGAMQTNAKPLRSEYENRVFAARQAERQALERAASAASTQRSQASPTGEVSDASGDKHSERDPTPQQWGLHESLYHNGSAAGATPPPPHEADSPGELHGLQGVRGATPRERRAAYRRQLEQQHNGGDGAL